jgi:hypothetical protein
MKSVIVRFVVPASILCGLSFAQDSTPPMTTSPAPQSQAGATQTAPANSTQPNAQWRIAPGSVIPVQLVKSVDAKKVKAGDEVDAKVTQDLKAGSGEIIVAKDTKMVGHVTAAQARSKEQKESQLVIAFDHAVMKNGDDVPLPMAIQAIIAPPGTNSGASDRDSDEPSGPPAPRGGMSAGNTSGRAGSPPTSTPSAASDEGPKGSPAKGREITGETQGVVGFSNLKLSAAADSKQGSVVSSEKNNVKLDGGTLMLLRVNQ